MATNVIASNPVGYNVQKSAPLFILNRAPGINDVNFTLGTIWLDQVHQKAYQLLSLNIPNTIGLNATWGQFNAPGGEVNSLTAGDSNVVSPTSGTVNVLGDYNISPSTGNITTTRTGPNTLSINLQPGLQVISVVTTGSIVDGGNLDVTYDTHLGGFLTVGNTATFNGGITVSVVANLSTTNIVGDANINNQAHGITNIGTDGNTGAIRIGTAGTGSVSIGNTTGNTAITGTLSSSGVITASTGLVATTGGITASAGGASITGTTTINTSGSSNTTIGVGGTGSVSIGNTTGGTSLTFTTANGGGTLSRYLPTTSWDASGGAVPNWLGVTFATGRTSTISVIGNVVTVSCYVVVASITDSTKGVNILGIPNAYLPGIGNKFPCSVFTANVVNTLGSSQIMAYISPNGITVFILNYADGTSNQVSELTNAQITSSFVISISCTYTI
jgi:hypothetical protein